MLAIGIAISDALTAAHEKGVIHRDLKPANVMVTREGRVKVLDFGLAKLEIPASELDLTQGATVARSPSIAGQVVGTVPYMAPEQLRGEATDSRTDLFALGIILYELTTGRRPFEGATPGIVSSAILRDTPPTLASVRPDAPVDLDRIVGRCLQKEPRARYQTALDVRNELSNVGRLDQVGAAIFKAPPTPSTPLIGREEHLNPPPLSQFSGLTLNSRPLFSVNHRGRF